MSFFQQFFFRLQLIPTSCTSDAECFRQCVFLTTISSDIKFFWRLVFPRMSFPYDIFFPRTSYSDVKLFRRWVYQWVYPTRCFAWRHGQQVPIDFENISGPSKSTTGVTLTNVLSCWFTNVCSNLAIKGASSLVSIRLWNFKDGGS
jgi:hypothetical protein